MPAPVLSVAATGEYSLPLVRCAQLLASCAEVQAMFGDVSASDAFDQIDYPLRDVESYGEALPGITVGGMKQKAGYNGDQSGEIEIALYDAINADFAQDGDTPIDWKNDALEWLNRCGAIRTQMKALSKTPLADFSGVRFNAIKWVDQCYPTHVYSELDSDGPVKWFRFAVFTVEWTT